MVNRIDIGIKERRAFLVMISLYLFLLYLGESGNSSVLVNSYATDFLFIPILMVAIKIVRWLFGLSFPIGKKEVYFSVLYAAVVFEWILPYFSDRYFADPFDVLAYFLGGAIYVLFISSEDEKRSKLEVKS